MSKQLQYENARKRAQELKEQYEKAQEEALSLLSGTKVHGFHIGMYKRGGQGRKKDSANISARKRIPGTKRDAKVFLSLKNLYSVSEISEMVKDKIKEEKLPEEWVELPVFS